MAVRTMCYLACDECLSICDGTEADSAAEARAIGAGFGWVRRDRRDLCLKCASDGPWYPKLEHSTWFVVRDRSVPDPKTYDFFDRAGDFQRLVDARARASQLNADSDEGADV